MKAVNGRWGQKILSMLLALTMVLTLASPAMAQVVARAGEQTVTVTMEYMDETGKTEYYLTPTQVTLEEGDILLDVLQRGYEGQGEVTYSVLYGFTVTPKDGQPVGEVGWGKKAWWPFVNSTKVGNKYEVSAGEVIRFVYVQDNAQGIPGYVPPTTGGGQGTLSINKDKLVSSLAQLSQPQIDANVEAYQQALQVAVDGASTQEQVNEQTAIVAQLLAQKVPATDITVTPEEVELMVGQTQQLTAQLTPEQTNDTVVWYSENTHVAQVTEEGVVRGVGEGTAVITAQANETVKATVTVTVTGVATQSLTLSQTSLDLEEGQGVQLLATVTPSNSTNPVTWQSSDPDRVTVDDSGLVVAHQAGTAQITATSGTCTQVCTVTVAAREIPTTPTVVFQHTDGRLTFADETGTFTLSALDEGKFILEGVAEGQSTYWSCSQQNGGSESSSVYISSGGVFYPTVGEYQAYVYDKNPEWYEATELGAFRLKVVPTQITDLKLYLDGWELSGEEPVYLSGTAPKQVTVKGCVDGVYISIPNQALLLTSTEGSYIYTMDDEGGVEFFAEDQAMHTFTVAVMDQPQVSVTFQATAKRIDVTGLTVTYPEVFYIESWNGLGNQYVGVTSHATDPEDRYEINIAPYNATVKDVVWVSHDPDIAEYQDTYNNGIVPKKAGTARFTVTSVDNPAASQTFSIEFAYKNPLEQVELEETEYSLPQFESMDLDLLVTPSNATNQRFTWTYSQEGVVKVMDYVTSTPGTMTTTHVLSALEQGTVTVTGTPLDDTMGAQPIQFTVTVTEPGAVEELDFDRYVTDNIDHALTYLEDQLESNYMYGAEWSLFTILRSGGSLSQKDLDTYYASVVQQVQQGGRMLPTDYFRLVVTLLVMGKDPTDVEGVDLVELMYNYPNLDRMTSNMMAFTLLALDAKEYEVPENALWSREVLVEKILTFQNENGGFGLSSAKTVSVDVTAMVLQALAPYRDQEAVAVAFEKALDYLQGEMTTDCGYINEGDDNGCTAAQVLTALAVAGIDPLDPDNGFTRGNYNLVTKLDQFKRETGFTTFGSTQQPDGMGTAQIGYALEAYRRFVAGEPSLYDLTTWTPAPPTGGDEDETEDDRPVPNTGDQAHLAGYGLAVMVSAVGLWGMACFARKKED
ncbi:Ig-like domain-containing protein [Pseudoflavonifractor sp. An85]|uniref:Ig-like domain-containing protein n=1 Tax=Pseudoflavonifractor sp. An85 TaxID=1965661 RepID=UPI000B375C8D|nr:Ig-like domain-containing protein [Pseudoflavonifractor sp. An85]OUN25432.1 hypothetical protein B5G37_04275 [Pseudoflavonifractor sp. An85]